MLELSATSPLPPIAVLSRPTSPLLLAAALILPGVIRNCQPAGQNRKHLLNGTRYLYHLLLPIPLPSPPPPPLRPPHIIRFNPRQLNTRKYLHSNIPSDPICAGIAVRMEGTPHRLLHIYVFPSCSYCLCLSHPLNRHWLCSPRGFLIDVRAEIKCKAGCERKRPAVEKNVAAYSWSKIGNLCNIYFWK